MSGLTKVVQLAEDGAAVLVTDVDAEELALLENARKVLVHATRMLDGAEPTVGELRFTVRQLAASLRDVLDLTSGGGDQGGTRWESNAARG